MSGGPPSTATHADQTWTVNYGDPGLGVKRIDVSSPGNSGWDQTWSGVFVCAGTNSSRCPGSASLPRRIGNLTPGNHTIRVKVTDAVGRSTTRDWPLNVAYYSSIRYGGDNQVIDTDAEISAAIDGMRGPDGEYQWSGLTPEDMQTLAAADAFVAWGEEAAIDDGAAPEGTWEVDDGTAPVAEPFFPSSDVIQTFADADPDAEGSVAPLLIRITVGACFKYCDDAARAVFKGGKAGIKKVARSAKKLASAAPGQGVGLTGRETTRSGSGGEHEGGRKAAPQRLRRPSHRCGGRALCTKGSRNHAAMWYAAQRRT